jgi:outer membrane receptor protein involved in Fe transport
MMQQARHVRWTASALAIGIGLMHPAAAQTVPVGSETVDPALNVPEDAAQDIVVTGSRIARKDFSGESPIVTVSRDFLQNSGTATVDQALTTLPQFTGSSNSQTNGGAGTGVSRAGGRATANLRGLGGARTLVLLDGRRLQPSDPLGAVDLNTISPALIETVEVITGGASAVYGSDAVAGVVNFRLTPRFEGLRLDADTGVSSQGDAASYSIAATAGTSFGGNRGRVIASLSYFDRGDASRNTRSFFDDRLGACCGTNGAIIPDGTNLVGTAALANLFRGQYGTAVPSPGVLLSINRDGSVFGLSGGGPNLRSGREDGYIVSSTGSVSQLSGNDSQLQTPLKRFTAFGRAEYDIVDGITAYGQVNYAKYSSDTLSETGVLQVITFPITVRADNPFVTPDLRGLLNSRRLPNAPFNYYFTGTRAGRLSFEQDYEVAQYLAGFKGKLPVSDWSYDIYGSHGTTRQDERTRGYISRSRFNALVNGVDAAGVADGGQSICAGGYPIFGFEPISAACSDYLLRPTLNRARYEQNVLEATLQGHLIKLPAGDVRFAAGATYRDNSYNYVADEGFRQPTTTAPNGVVTVLPPDILGTAGIESTRGKVSVAEYYGELLIPVLRDLPMIRSLSVDLAFRLSDYSSVGSVKTYKAGLDWQITPWLGARGGYSRAIRAPSVGELFGEQRGVASSIGSVASGGGDPCDVRSAYRRAGAPNRDNVRALCIGLGIPASIVDTYNYNGNLIAGIQTGSAGLREETADSYTVGLVVRPRGATPLLSNLSLSIDYYNIKLDQAIGYVTAAVSFQRCFNADGSSNTAYDPLNPGCRNILRTSGGGLTAAIEPLQNLSGYRTSGVDFQLDWRVDLDDVGLGSGTGALVLNSVVGYLDSYRIQTISPGAFVDYAGTIGNGQIDPFAISHPRWKSTSTLTYARDRSSIGLRWRYIDRQTNSNNVGTQLQAPGVASRSYYDVLFKFAAGPAFELHGGVINLMNTKPPVWIGNGAVDSSTYDIIGTRFFIGATAKF